MNNAFLTLEAVKLYQEKEIDLAPILREKEAELLETISAVQKISKTKEWSTLKTKVFDGITEHLSQEITREARIETPDTLKLNRLAGQLKWAERYSDLQKFEDSLRVELTNVRNKLNQYGKN